MEVKGLGKVKEGFHRGPIPDSCVKGTPGNQGVRKG